MKVKLLFLVILIAASCSNKKEKENVDIKKKINFQQVNLQIDDENNSQTASDTIKQRFLDTLNTSESPVKIISSKLSINQYSDHKDIRLVYKNVSKKRIGAIRFEWYCENSFNKPASGKYFFIKGRAEGDSNIVLQPGKIGSQIWEDFSTDAQTIISVRACFVAFSDGTNWELK